MALQCALACLTLIKGRLQKDKQMLRRSLALTQSNLDALILYTLLEVADQNYGAAI
jgi:hypothetical protein